MIIGAIKQNSGHVEVPYRMLRKNTFLGALCNAVVESFGRGENGCSWGYGAFREKLRISKTTVWRAFRGMKDDDRFEIGRMGECSGESRYLHELKHEKHLTVLNWFRTEELLFTYKDDEGKLVGTVERRLKDSEVALLSFIYTIRIGGEDCEQSYIGLAGILGYTPETICRDIKHLRAAGLIKRIRRGRNGTKNRFTIDWAEFKRIDKYHRKQQKKAEQDAASALNAKKLDRSEYYKELELERQAKAEKYMMQVYEQVPSFEKIQSEIEKLENPKNATLKKDNPVLYIAMQKKLSVLQAQRRELALKMKIDLARFDPGYYGKAQCLKCRGTGRALNGALKCDCWKRGRRQE